MIIGKELWERVSGSKTINEKNWEVEKNVSLTDSVHII
jgi:hypothetical protein